MCVRLRERKEISLKEEESNRTLLGWCPEEKRGARAKREIKT
jgi:hypothetical protein